MFVQDGTEDEFWKIRPTLCEFDRQLLNCYYGAKRDSEQGKILKDERIREALQECFIEDDIGLHILRNVDHYCIELYIQKLKMERGKK